MCPKGLKDTSRNKGNVDAFLLMYTSLSAIKYLRRALKTKIYVILDEKNIYTIRGHESAVQISRLENLQKYEVDHLKNAFWKSRFDVFILSLCDMAFILH